MNRLLRLSGLAASFCALFLMLGGHWLALQTVAWTRMVVDFSRHDSLRLAVAKTLSGEHPCELCLKIRQGRQQEKQQQKLPSLQPEKMPDLFWDARPVTAPPAPAQAASKVLFPAQFYSDFIDAPPSPPPRPAGRQGDSFHTKVVPPRCNSGVVCSRVFILAFDKRTAINVNRKTSHPLFQAAVGRSLDLERGARPQPGRADPQ